jgi:hypothetical protein
MTTRTFLKAFFASAVFAPLTALAGAGDPNCPPPIQPPTELQFAGAAVSLDYPGAIRKKAEFRQIKYAAANDALDAWMKKKYGVTMAEFSGPAPKPSRRSPDPDEIAREREKILSVKEGQARALFDAWLKRRYAVGADEFDKAISDYFDRQKLRFQTELMAAHLTSEQCPGGSHE